MHRILIYAINGKGMGHLNRTLVLAQAAREFAPETQILFVVASPLFWLVRDSGFAVLKVPDRNHELAFHVGKESRVAHQAGIFEMIFDLYRPTSFVVDMALNVPIFESAKRRGAQVAVVLRKQRATILAATQRDLAIKWVDHFLIPHPTEEFPLQEIPTRWHARVQRLGPVVRTLQMDRVSKARERYSNSRRALVVVTIGGGGFPESYETLAAAEQAALDSTDEIDWVLVYGPYYPNTIPPNQGNVRRVKFEPDLLELCTAADVVVCNAGYNTMREIAVAGTPAVVIPLRGTGADDQYERADLLARNGNAVVGKAIGPDLLNQVRNLLNVGAQTRRAPEPGEPAVELGRRFLHALG